MGGRIAAVALALAAAGCASVPTPNPRLEAARRSWETANADARVAAAAGPSMAAARDALQRADQAWRGGASIEEVDHLAYLAGARTQAALETARLAAAEQQIVSAGAERDQLVLERRTREAQLARQQSQAAQQQAEAAGRALSDANRQAADAQAEAQRLARQLEGLQSRATDRGVVVTLQDVLFESGHASLQPGAARAIDQLAQAMQSNPGQRVTVAGFTDAVGDASSNRVLSVRRAQAVKDALVQRGVAPERIDTVGFGEDYPVASNGDAAGRQMNRRVEIAFEGSGGAANAAAG